MAYACASLLSFMQSLEHLLDFAGLILLIKSFHVESFGVKARLLARLFEEFSSSTDQSHRTLFLAQLVQTLDEDGRSKYVSDTPVKKTELFLNRMRLLRLVKDEYVFDKPTDSRFDMVLEESKDVEFILEEVPKILKEIGHAEVELRNFFVNLPEILKEIDLAELKNFSFGKRMIPEDSETPLKWIQVKVGGVLSAIIKLKTETNFVHKEAMKMKVLCQDLSFLMAFLRDSAYLCKNHDAVNNLEKWISGMVSRAEDFIDQKWFNISLQSKSHALILELLNSALTESRLPEMDIALIEIFHKKNGIVPVLLSKFQEIESLKEKVKIMYDETPDIENWQSSSISAKVSKPPLVKEDMVVGLNDISNEILDTLSSMQLPGLEIATIVGMGGIGKTTLARKVYDHPTAVCHFHCRAWVTVSQVYKVRDLLLGLLRSVMQLRGEIYKMSEEDLAKLLYQRLKGRRYLIVMDDIWNIKAWDDFNKIFPDDRNGSRVLLTSRLKRVAVHVNPKSPPYCMGFLGEDESWKLLEQKVFGKGSCPPQLEDLGKHMVHICQGLPLAIVVLAGYLSRIKRTYNCWEYTAASVSSLVITNPEECLEILALSYNYLPHHLKACFLYMGAFPEDWEIEVPKLINLWIAEGFLDLMSSKSLEEVGEDCLDELVDRSLVLVAKRSSSGKIRT